MKSEKSINDRTSTELYKDDYEWKILWHEVIVLLYVHLAGIYGFYVLCFRDVKFWSIIWTLSFYAAAILGMTAGAHRLWSHRSFKAKWPMKLILMIFQTIGYQNSIYQWARDHRVHHKYTDTNADPYNINRGFFFAHIGWIMTRKHPDFEDKVSTIDCSDLDQDPIVVFQKKWFVYLMPLCCFVIPTLVPWLVWDESLWYSWHLVVCRFCISLNSTWTINSIAHMWGMKPYDKSLSSAQSASVSLLTLGEGWHNYHHAFPWDYKAEELGSYGLNLSTAFIDLFASLGLAYDLKTTSDDVIKKRVRRSGDINEYENHIK